MTITPTMTDAAQARKPIIDRYADGGLILVQAASGLTPEQTLDHPGPGDWSLAELVAHLADSDLVLSDRIKRVIAEENPTLLAFPENDWLARLHSGRLPVEAAAALFAANRVWMTHILRSLDDSAFARVGNHTESGRLTLAEIVVKSVHHLDHHLKFLYAKRAKLGVAIYPALCRKPGVLNQSSGPIHERGRPIKLDHGATPRHPPDWRGWR